MAAASARMTAKCLLVWYKIHLAIKCGSRLAGAWMSEELTCSCWCLWSIYSGLEEGKEDGFG